MRNSKKRKRTKEAIISERTTIFKTMLAVLISKRKGIHIARPLPGMTVNALSRGFFSPSIGGGGGKEEKIYFRNFSVDECKSITNSPIKSEGCFSPLPVSLTER